MEPLSEANLAIILLNWRNPSDTIECLESVFRSDFPAKIIVCDNASGDGSVDQIIRWAEGTNEASAKSEAMLGFSSPAVLKPITIQHLNAEDVNSGAAPTAQLTIIETGGNLGFAGGNNVGLQCALNDPLIQYFWLLNNDTVIDSQAPAAVVRAFQQNNDSSKLNIGMLGTLVRYYYAPNTVQALNGSRFNPWNGRGYSIGGGQNIADIGDIQAVAQKTDYVLGASLAVSRDFLRDVGLMEEGYFLYFEEIDWATRARGKFSIGYAEDAIIYHKEGGSIGSNIISSKRSAMSEFYLSQSKLRFTRKHHPYKLPIVTLFEITLAMKRMAQANFKNGSAILKGISASFGQKLRYWS